ncbi:MAG TPA: cytochrome c biogenesis protein CcdA [Candidatus Kapabacteria bacterium]|nr:cytochrome c biogenesis protein CcdA [Candidatus Kapabacteria bacterium]
MLKKLVFISIVFALCINLAMSQANDDVKVEIYPSKSSAKAGEEIWFKAVFKIKHVWYTYGLVEVLGPEGLGPTPSEIKILPNDVFELPTTVYVQKPKIKFDSGFVTNIEVYKDEAEFYIPIKLKKDFDINTVKPIANFYLQLCDSTHCLPGTDYQSTTVGDVMSNSAEDIQAKIKDLIKVNIASNGEFLKNTYDSYKPFGNKEELKEAQSIEPQQTESSQLIEQKKKEGLFSFLWFSMLMGAISLLTPCVFPMIPITVSFFTKRNEKAKGKGLRDSLVYSLGIILTFTMIGVIVSIIAGPTGISQMAANGWVNLFIAAVFIIFAFNLFGAFEIQIPTSLLNLLNTKSQGDGIGSVLVMGLVFSLTSFTCTVPFVGSSLISVSSGDWFYPILGMLGFSTVFAAPFFLLALFPSFMNKVPRAGGWMNNIKVVMGFIEIAAAIKFLSNADLYWFFEILSRDLFLSIWIGVCIMIILYILGIFRLHHDSPFSSVGSPRIAFALIFTAITVWLITGLLGKPLGELDSFMPRSDYATTATISAGIANPNTQNTNSIEEKWFKTYEEGLQYAKEHKMNIFLDFTGWQCTNCRWMEMNMFPREEVASRLQKFVKIKLYTDSRKPEEQANKKFQQDRYNSIELPLYVIMTPDEKLIGTNAFTRDTEEFVKFLDRGLN